MNTITKYIILFFILIVVGILYRKLEDKRMRDENKDNYEAIQNYLLDGVTLANSVKPILWIHVPYEYNSRKWLSFGSRSSFDLNQPYLNLTVRSIIKKCEQSFTICIIDDNSFARLIPRWSIDMTRISSPISDNMRKLGMAKLIYIYGGINCPISFLCMKDLIGLYDKGTRGDKMFLCETTDRNITSTTFNFYPDISFFGSPKENHILKEFIDFMQRIISTDFTDQSKFVGDFDRWCEARIRENKMNMISGLYIGIKTVEDEPILLENLMSQHYLKLYPKTYGILIPAREILKRVSFEWFARLSEKQVLESKTIIGSYILLETAPGNQNGILEPLKTKPDWVSFWKVPSNAPVWGLKPNFLGDNVLKEKHPSSAY